MTMPDQPTADTTRALITDEMVGAAWRAHRIEEWGDDLDPEDNGEGQNQSIRAALAAALSVYTREDADLDAIEAAITHPTAAAYLDRLRKADAAGALSDYGRAQLALPALLARVRTAEAERDEARAALGRIADHDCTDHEHDEEH
jgi:hypothetical protein